jgi:hypothetical protein
VTPADVAVGRLQIRACHHAKRGDAAQQQHRVGLGEPRLDAEQHRGCHHQTGEIGGPPRDEGERGPIGQQHGADRTEQRGNAIEPDRRARLRHTERFGGPHDAGLQPVDSDRLLVTDLVLVADVDVIAALDHLLGRLREPRFVAIDRRNVDEARQERDQRDRDQERDRAQVRRGGECQQRAEVLQNGCRREPRVHVPSDGFGRTLVHDPEKWKPVFAKRGVIRWIC